MDNMQPGPHQRHYHALAEVYLIEMCNLEEWLILNKDTAPETEVFIAKLLLTSTMHRLNNVLELSNQ